MSFAGPSPSAGAHTIGGDVQRAASQWFARNHAPAADPAEPAFLAWLAESPENEAEYRKIEAMWASDAFQASAHRARARDRSVNRRHAAFGLVAFAMLALGGLRIAGIELALPADHATRIGEREVAVLADGTRIELDSATAIDVRYGSRRRTVILRRGRVMIDVAQDRRPFSLVAGGSVVRDVGTDFSVERVEAGIRVAVREGAVDLQAEGRVGNPVALRAGQAGGLADGHPIPTRATNEQLDFGWRRERVYFSQEPLGQVVARLRRYHKGWIVVADDRIARRPITGGVDASRPVEAMAELARLSGGDLVRMTDSLLILR